MNTPRTRCESLVKQTAIRVAQSATQQKKKQKRGSCQAPLFAFIAAIPICFNVLLGWRWIRVRSSMMVASAVMLAGVMIGVMPMGVVRSSIEDGIDRPRLK
jgi:hypothetical protein